MKWQKYTAGFIFILYILLIIYPLSIYRWIPWVLLALLFVAIYYFKDISKYLSIITGALFIQTAGGPSSNLFFSYIPLIFLLKDRGLKIKAWWLIIPLFALFKNYTFYPYLILYGSIVLIYMLDVKKEEEDKEIKTGITTDYEQKKIRESITKTLSFPRDLSGKFEETLSSSVELIYHLFQPWSVLILLKNHITNSFNAKIGKSKGNLDEEASIKKGPLSWFYSNSGILINNEYNDSSINLGYYKEEEYIKCFLASSIEINGKIEGIVVVDRRERLPFENHDRDILDSISKSISTLFSLYKYMNASMLEAFRFQSLLNLTGKIAGEIHLEEVRTSIFETISTSFEKAWAIFILKEDGEYYITEQDGRRYKRPLKNSIVALSLQKTISLCKEDLTKETKRPILLPEERDFGAKSLLFSPFRGNIEGGILLLSDESNNFNKKDLMVLNLITDIAASAVEKAILYDHEREKAIRDGLTQVYNHRFFQEILDKRLASCKRNKENLSLLMLDIDNFKDVNDKYGHQTGDMVLREMGKVLNDRIRTSDILARYGGEEFAIILPKTQSEHAFKLAEILRKTIEELIFKSTSGENLSVTTSIGISEFPKHGKNKDDLVAAADRALYIAKKQGKNRSLVGEY